MKHKYTFRVTFMATYFIKTKRSNSRKFIIHNSEVSKEKLHRRTKNNLIQLIKLYITIIEHNTLCNSYVIFEKCIILFGNVVKVLQSISRFLLTFEASLFKRNCNIWHPSESFQW